MLFSVVDWWCYILILQTCTQIVSLKSVMSLTIANITSAHRHLQEWSYSSQTGEFISSLMHVLFIHFVKLTCYSTESNHYNVILARDVSASGYPK